MTDKITTEFDMPHTTLHAVKLSENNIEEICDELELQALYDNGLPYAIRVNWQEIAEVDDFIVMKGSGLMTVVDPYTFDFFFSTHN